MVSKLFYFLTLLVLANAATWMGRLPSKPKELAHKEGCYIKEINDVIPFGEDIVPIGQCYRIECSRHRIYYASCGVVSTPDKESCFVTKYDIRRPYPECCPQVKCEIDNNIL